MAKQGAKANTQTLSLSETENACKQYLGLSFGVCFEKWVKN
jgi:hypothetical protein